MQAYRFHALGSPCEIQVDGAPWCEIERLGRIAEQEALRIERKYSRYREDSVLAAINRVAGVAVAIDAETHGLLHYADQCWRLSGGRFDITSGVLRRVWRFDGSDGVPDAAAVERVRALVGWERVELTTTGFRMEPGMEIDFGGLGKEYAVDRATLLLGGQTTGAVLVNFGGDLRVSGPRRGGAPWRIAIEAVDGADHPGLLELRDGALTTSGDAKRYLMKDGIRYGHILDPRTGWPVADPPRSVTVAAGTCMEAGMLSTFAMLHGIDAEAFLAAEQVPAWVLRPDAGLAP
jgi:thiamine biosynthesis lipoprotein